ncbi:MAG: murein biosynthesis integral membrane protein MurJ [Candidatus Babeliales bacterium]
MSIRKSVLKQTIHIGGSTLLSRLLGLVREILMANYLGPTALGEAFITAFKIPNSLRKIFAEGALSVAFVPTAVQVLKKEGEQRVSKLMTLTLLLFESALILICLLCIWKAVAVIHVIMPGWFVSSGAAFQWSTVFYEPMHALRQLGDMMHHAFSNHTALPEQVAYTVQFLRILMGFIVLLSISALLAGALQAAHHFLVPALSPVLLNLSFIGGLLVCMRWQLMPTVLCWCIMAGGVVQLVLHMWMYRHYQFSFARPDARAWHDFKEVWKKFLPCLLSMSIMEIYLFIDTSIGSYLPTGSIALIYYANRFMQIPLGVIASALSTILLPYFARVGTYAPRRLSYYLFESAKLIVWVMLPIALVMGLVAYEIFYTLFLSAKFTEAHVLQAASILHASLYGILFFSLNKILLNIYYSLHDTKTPMYISIICVLLNGIFSYYGMQWWGAYGIVLGTTLAGAVQTALSVILLKKFQFTFYGYPFIQFMIRCLLQLTILGTVFVGGVQLIKYMLQQHGGYLATLLLSKIWFWGWYVPCAGIFMLLLFKTRPFFGIQISFLDA